MTIAPGRVLDYVTAWCRRAEAGEAGELRLSVKDGEIAILEEWRRPRPVYKGRQRPQRQHHHQRQRNGVRAESAQASPVATAHVATEAYQSPSAPPPNRCPRSDCQGTLIDDGAGETICLLCGRGRDDDGGFERWALSGLMAEPPGPVVSYRAGPAEAMGLDKRGPYRKSATTLAADMPESELRAHFG